MRWHFWGSGKSVVGKIDPEKGVFDQFLKNVSSYELDLDDVANAYYFTNDPIQGIATSEGTYKYTLRNQDEISKDNFK